MHILFICVGGTCGVTFIIVGNGYGNLSTNPGSGCLNFT